MYPQRSNGWPETRGEEESSRKWACWTRVEHRQVHGKCESWGRADLPGLNRLNWPSLPSAPTTVNKTLEAQISIPSSIWAPQKQERKQVMTTLEVHQPTALSCQHLVFLQILSISLATVGVSPPLWSIPDYCTLCTRKQRAFNWLVRLRYRLSESSFHTPSSLTR